MALSTSFGILAGHKDWANLTQEAVCQQYSNAQGFGMKAKLCGLIALIALLNVTRAGATTFNLENLEIAPSYSVTGSITTNGATGTLSSQTDISSWNLIINTGNGPVDLNGPGNPATSAVNYTGLALSVVGTGLFFNYGLSTASFFEIGTTTGPNENVVLEDAGQGGGPLLQFNDGVDSQSSSSVSGNIQIGTASISATPLPAALPLFAAGLGAMGLFGWRRKQKSAATIAAA
jgi:hypothetical protein